MCKAAKVRIKSNSDPSLCALALQRNLVGIKYMQELQTLGDLPLVVTDFMDIDCKGQ